MKRVFKRVSKLTACLIVASLIINVYPYKAGAEVESAWWGTQTHKAVTQVFHSDMALSGSTVNSGKMIPKRFSWQVNRQFPDFVIDYKGPGTTTDIYELKPDTWFSSASKRKKATTQINGYVSTYSQVFPSRIPVRRGTSWSVNGRVVPVAQGTVVQLFSNYQTDPGLVFYKFINAKSQPIYATAQKTVKSSSGQTFTVFAKEPKYNYVLAYSLIASGVIVVVATLVEDVLTAGLGTADDPASFAAAAALIQRGWSALPAGLEAQMLEQQYNQY